MDGLQRRPGAAPRRREVRLACSRRWRARVSMARLLWRRWWTERLVGRRSRR